MHARVSEQRVSSSGLSLNVREHTAAGQRKPHVILVHGYPDQQDMWDLVVESLDGDAFHIVTYDVRGAGGSDVPPSRDGYRTELLVEDLIAVLDATVPPDEQIHLVGHDWGSMAMWDVVAAETWDPRLEGRLASYTSASGPSLDHLGSMSETKRGKLRMLPQTVRSWYIWLFLIPWLPEQLWSHAQWFVRRTARLLDPTVDLLPWGPELRHNARHSLNLYRANVVPRLRNPMPWRTSVPVLLVVATRDAWLAPVSLSGLDARCRDLSRVEIKDGHWLPRARPEELAGLVATFVRRA